MSIKPSESFMRWYRAQSVITIEHMQARISSLLADAVQAERDACAKLLDRIADGRLFAGDKRERETVKMKMQVEALFTCDKCKNRRLERWPVSFIYSSKDDAIMVSDKELPDCICLSRSPPDTVTP